MNHRMCILPLLLVAIFASCSPTQSEYERKNTSDENKVDNSLKINWQDSLSQNDDHYLVFFYSDTCHNCHEIMGDVIAFSTSEIIPLYFLDIKDPDNEVIVSNSIDETIGATSVEDLCILGTPTIIEVEDHCVKANVPGKENCLSLLNELRLIYS